MAVTGMDQGVVVPPKTYKARVLNLEKGLPTVEEGRNRLLEAVKRTSQLPVLSSQLRGGANLAVGGRLRGG